MSFEPSPSVTVPPVPFKPSPPAAVTPVVAEAQSSQLARTRARRAGKVRWGPVAPAQRMIWRELDL